MDDTETARIDGLRQTNRKLTSTVKHIKYLRKMDVEAKQAITRQAGAVEAKLAEATDRLDCADKLADACDPMSRPAATWKQRDTVREAVKAYREAAK